MCLKFEWRVNDAATSVLEGLPENLQEMELAAEDRYREAVELLSAGRWGGGVYVAEIFLKIAAIRLEKAHSTDLVGGFFGPARKWIKARCPGVNRESYHSLLFWSTYLRDNVEFKVVHLWAREIGNWFDEQDGFITFGGSKCVIVRIAPARRTRTPYMMTALGFGIIT